MYALIPGKLFQSGAHGTKLGPSWETVQAQHVDVIVDLSGEVRGPCRIAPMLISWPIVDGSELPDLKKLGYLAEHLAALVQRDHVVLVSCLRGINRSSLLNARVLMVLESLSGKEAVQRIRSVVSNALNNVTFTRYLEGL